MARALDARALAFARLSERFPDVAGNGHIAVGTPAASSPPECATSLMNATAQAVPSQTTWWRLRSAV